MIDDEAKFVEIRNLSPEEMDARIQAMTPEEFEWFRRKVTTYAARMMWPNLCLRVCEGERVLDPKDPVHEIHLLRKHGKSAANAERLAFLLDLPRLSITYEPDPLEPEA